MTVNLVTDSKELAKLCKKWAKEKFITLDTEFLREKTYYPQLCLIQVGGKKERAAIDPLADDIDLQPLLDLLANEKVLKVLHAARQDLEIFFRMMGSVPAPLFDTQVAAQVMGLGEQIGYQNLISKVLDIQIDKGQQFTDWSRRPLSDSQLEYAMNDVIYLYDAYILIMKDLLKSGRDMWLVEEMDALTASEMHYVEPDEAFERIRSRLKKAEQLGRLRQLAAWREDKAQELDVPRNRLIRDDALVELATNLPKSEDRLRATRAFPQHMKADLRHELWRLCEALPDLPKSEWVEPKKKKRSTAKTEGRLEMLRLLMKQNTREHNVSAGFVANRETLEEFASGDYEKTHPLLQGWRYEVFGKDALELMDGKRAAILDPETGDIRFKEV